MTKDELSDFMFSEFICGCGQPEQVCDTLLGLLRYIALPYDPEVDTWAGMQELVPHGPSLYLWLYMLDKTGITEHGGSVPGWLTGKGQALMEALILHGSDVDAWKEFP